jgi:hypothetical protein
MRKNKRRPRKFLILSIVSLVALAYLIYFFPPDYKVQIPILDLSFLISHLSFPLLFLFIFSTATYLTKSTKHGVLLGLFAISALGLKLTNLTHPFFFLLLAGFFLMLELLISNQK